MGIVLHNTLTGQKEPLVTREPGRVAMYVCGVTPYDRSHIGHARPAIVFDVLRRYLRTKGFAVQLVQNFTDVDDKIIARAAERGLDPLTLSQRFSDEYLDMVQSLGVEPADVYPKVTDHIPDIVAMIEALIDKGAAYAADGDVFFDVTRFPEYGKLSHQRLDELVAGARVEVDPKKRHAADFALWKAAKPHEPAWPSPWGPGRPGWHIECSAMSLKYLGNGFDIHGGGMDLVFPHHENEIAQSEAFTATSPFARYWLHAGLITVRGEKMAKSLGNSVWVSDLLRRHPKEWIRFFMLSHHYRTPLDFTEEGLRAAGKGWQRLNQAVAQLAERALGAEEHGAHGAPRAGEAPPEPVARLAAAFDAAMADDVNTAAAIGALFEGVRAARSAGGDGSPLLATAAYRALRSLAGEVLGILTEDAIAGRGAGAEAHADGRLTGPLVELLIELRGQARQTRDYERADRIRDRLAGLGVILEDGPEGTTWRAAEPDEG